MELNVSIAERFSLMAQSLWPNERQTHQITLNPKFTELVTPELTKSGVVEQPFPIAIKILEPEPKAGVPHEEIIARFTRGCVFSPERGEAVLHTLIRQKHIRTDAKNIVYIKIYGRIGIMWAYQLNENALMYLNANLIETKDGKISGSVSKPDIVIVPQHLQA